MPYIRVGKCVYKKTKSGKRGEKKGCSKSTAEAKKYIKKLYSLDESSEEHIFILDAVNEVVSSLPIGHKNRNSQFAKQILQKVFEEFTNHEQVSYEEVLEITKKLSGGIELL
tara:strand:- start:191 stop:526 length:336 start_codon:yes stop_codon:yes gene_type:complete